jgi:hypothetical protein
MYLILFCHQGSSGINSSKEIMLNSISLPAGTKALIDFWMQIISRKWAENGLVAGQKTAPTLKYLYFSITIWLINLGNYSRYEIISYPWHFLTSSSGDF